MAGNNNNGNESRWTGPRVQLSTVLTLLVIVVTATWAIFTLVDGSENRIMARMGKNEIVIQQLANRVLVIEERLKYVNYDAGFYVIDPHIAPTSMNY